jgi:non-heme chloroperoxidase
MPFVTTGRENSAEIRIYYEDHGTGSPVVLVHGYALNGRSWEKQEAILLAAGHRVITYDRRGFGASSRPSVGYDFDTLAGDLHVPLSRLNFRGVVLAGFAMGTGEVARYLAVHGSGRVSAAVLVAPLPPFLLKTGDSPDGIDRSVFDRLTACTSADRPAAMKDFMDDSYNVDILGGDRGSDQALPCPCARPGRLCPQALSRWSRAGTRRYGAPPAAPSSRPPGHSHHGEGRAGGFTAGIGYF